MRTSCFADVNGIKLHYLDYPGTGQPLIFLHGLTANAWTFDPLARKLSPHFHVIAVDQRGRGLSDKPATGYSMADHAADIFGLMDALGIEQGIVGGHSYGGLVTLYMAAYHPERISKAIVIDAGLMHPKVAELIGPSVGRLGKTWPNWDSYVQTMRDAPPLHDFWDKEFLDYLRADLEFKPDGSVTPRTSPESITEASVGVGTTNWVEVFSKNQEPVLLLNAIGGYGPGDTPAVMPVEQAKMTAAMLAQCRYVQVPGNHMTMMYKPGVETMVQAISSFVDGN
jgi:pimeloyl-ACP methyl ester carboxylesterase